MLEFYRYLELLKNYKVKYERFVFDFFRRVYLLLTSQVLNSTAIVKILKKYDKLSNTKISALYMEKIKTKNLMASNVIDALLLDVENMFVDFMNTTRQRAMQVLRLPDKQISHYFTTWRSGLFLGLSLPAVAYSLKLVATGETTIEQPLTILQIYAGLAIPILFLFLFSANLLVWTKYRVNYTVIESCRAFFLMKGLTSVLVYI